MLTLKRSLCAIALLFSTSLLANPESINLLEKHIDEIANKSIPSLGPGCSVGVIRDGNFIFNKSYGLANIEHQIPLSSESVYRMASVSKQFTAFAILLLADDGLIDLEEDIRAYIPDLYDYGVKVSINSLLGHFSGIGDYDSLKRLLKTPLLSATGNPFRLGDEDYLTNDEYYTMIKSLPLANQPDTKQKYSNFAYNLLAVLVKNVSGMSLRAFSEKRIFKPLGMNSTLFADDKREIIPNRAMGYRTFKEGNKEIVKQYMTNIYVVGDGGLHTSLNDMLIWDNHFYHPTLGKNPKQLMALMNKPNSEHTFENDGKTYYANGQYIDHKYAMHNGGWMGTSTSYIRRPAQKTSFIAMCNSSSLDADDFTYNIPAILTQLKIWAVTDPSIY